MQSFSKAIAGFVASNPNFLLFLCGFSVFCGSVSIYSAALAGIAGGVILMTIAAYPFLKARKD